MSLILVLGVKENIPCNIIPRFKIGIWIHYFWKQSFVWNRIQADFFLHAYHTTYVRRSVSFNRML